MPGPYSTDFPSPSLRSHLPRLSFPKVLFLPVALRRRLSRCQSLPLCEEWSQPPRCCSCTVNVGVAVSSHFCQHCLPLIFELQPTFRRFPRLAVCWCVRVPKPLMKIELLEGHLGDHFLELSRKLEDILDLADWFRSPLCQTFLGFSPPRT